MRLMRRHSAISVFTDRVDGTEGTEGRGVLIWDLKEIILMIKKPVR